MKSIGTTYGGRAIPLIKISSGGSNKPAILVDAGIHAREWIAPPVALYIINQLVENPDNAALFANVDWYIIPILNPDGYSYTHTSVSKLLMKLYVETAANNYIFNAGTFVEKEPQARLLLLRNRLEQKLRLPLDGKRRQQQ